MMASSDKNCLVETRFEMSGDKNHIVQTHTRV